MKSNVIRMLAIMTLATSISAFALPEKPATATKTDCCPACETTPASSKAVRSEGQSDNSQDQSERQRLIREQEKQWLQDVQNNVAG